MFTGKIARMSVALGLMAAVLPAAVKAVPLAPGGGVALAGTTFAAQPWLGGAVVVDTLRPFVVKNGAGIVVAKGVIQDRVVKSAATGTYHYYFRLFNDATSAVPIGMVARESFSGHFTDVNYRLDGLGDVGPKAAFRDATGKRIRYDFHNAPIFPGRSSRFVFAATRATTINASGVLSISAVNNLGFGMIRAYQP